MIKRGLLVVVAMIAINANPVQSASIKYERNKERKAYIEYMDQVENYPVPSLDYWYKVAKCETRSDWQDHGTYAGGLGIYTNARFRDSGMGTWERWGGEEFALTPGEASILQQIVIANRIAVVGWKTEVIRKDKTTYLWERTPVGYLGWGCIKNTVGLPKTQKKGKKNVRGSN